MIEHNKSAAKGWVKATLFTAFLYSTIWGIITIFLPQFVFVSSHIKLPEPIILWQIIGIIDIVFGLGYLMSLNNPYRTWQPVFMGLVYKTLVIAIFLSAAWSNAELWNLRNFLIINNLIWLVPFGMILNQAYKRSYDSDETLIDIFDADEFTLDMFDTSEGTDLQELSEQQPTMVVMLRHFGCTFCREALTELAQIHGKIERKGTKLVLVHMLEDEDMAHEQLYKYGLEDVTTISDPEEILYKRFKLRKGTFSQLLGITDLYRGFVAGVLKGHGLGKEMGDIMQMPGVFLLYNGEIVKSFIHKHSSDKPPYLELADYSDVAVPA